MAQWTEVITQAVSVLSFGCHLEHVPHYVLLTLRALLSAECLRGRLVPFVWVIMRMVR